MTVTPSGRVVTQSHDKPVIDHIVEQLRIPGTRQESGDQIASLIDGAKRRIAFDARLPKPGAMKRTAAKLRRTLAKAKTLSNEIEPMLSALMFELGDGDIYESYKARLVDAIHATTEIEKQIIVPPGAQPRDIAKFEAKRLATELVGQFDSTENRELMDDIVNRSGFAGGDFV